MFSAFLIVPILMHYYFAMRLISRLQHSQWLNSQTFSPRNLKLIIWSLTIFMFIFQTTFFIGRRTLIPELPESNNYFDLLHSIKYFSYTLMGVFAISVITLLVVDVVNFLRKLIHKLKNLYFKNTNNQATTSEVNFNRRALIASGLFITGNSAVGLVEYHSEPEIVSITLPIRNLPQSFQGFRIVQISDLHLGDLYTEKYAHKITTLVNQHNADLVALTGDVVDGKTNSTIDMVRPLQNLKSTFGTFMVSGNHEYYSGWDMWENEFKNLGFHVLSNEHQIIKIDNAQIAICGVTDYSTKKVSTVDFRYKKVVISDPTKACVGLPPNIPKILLAHQPSDYELASANNYDLMLSGHTHGGQFFPLNLIVANIHKYYKGLYLHNNMWVYVSKGTGSWGPPLRTMVPNEITVFTLEKA